MNQKLKGKLFFLILIFSLFSALSLEYIYEYMLFPLTQDEVLQLEVFHDSVIKEERNDLGIKLYLLEKDDQYSIVALKQSLIFHRYQKSEVYNTDHLATIQCQFDGNLLNPALVCSHPENETIFEYNGIFTYHYVITEFNFSLVTTASEFPLVPFSFIISLPLFICFIGSLIVWTPIIFFISSRLVRKKH